MPDCSPGAQDTQNVNLPIGYTWLMVYFCKFIKAGMLAGLFQNSFKISIANRLICWNTFWYVFLNEKNVCRYHEV